jgi:hypothetical protein
MHYTAAVMLLLSVVGLPARAQQKVSPTELSGDWLGTLVLDNSKPSIRMTFVATDTTLEGKVYSDGTLVGPMENPSFADNKVHFKVGQLDFTGLVAGTSMKVDLIVYNGSTRSFVATKQPAP